MKKLLSFVFPFTLKKYQSKFNGTLEVNLVNGRKVLDTATTNYSYGSLQQVLKLGLVEAGFNIDMPLILVLGMGGGSIVSTIRDDLKSKATIHLVDIDPDIIAIAKNEFGITSYHDINIIQADAADYVAACNQGYDIIVIDLFIIDTVPEKFTQPQFIANVCACLKPKGRVIFNTMRKTMPEKTLSRIKGLFLANGLIIRVLEEVQHTNDLIIAQKK